MKGFYSFFNILILLGAMQGFIVSSLLFFSKRRHQSNRLLAILILLISLACFNLYGAYNNWFGSDLLRFLADILPLVIIMPVGPLIYFYVQSVINPSFKLTRKHRRYFYPAIVDLGPTIIIVVFIIGLLLRVLKNKPGPWGAFIDNYNVYADIPRWASVTFYLWLSVRYLSKLKSANNLPAKQQPANIRWLWQFVRVFVVFQAVWLIYLVPYVIPKYTDKMLDTFEWYPLYLPLVGIIYWLGIKGYMSQNAGQDKKLPANQAVLSAAVIRQVVTAITITMENDKLYLNPVLNLDMVANHTGLPAKTISAVLNQHMNKSFNEFVNSYRINAFKQKMQQPEMDNLTIAGIAFDCGFNSQATFQRTFKQVTGMSPTEYRKSTLVPQ